MCFLFELATNARPQVRLRLSCDGVVLLTVVEAGPNLAKGHTVLRIRNSAKRVRPFHLQARCNLPSRIAYRARMQRHPSLAEDGTLPLQVEQRYAALMSKRQHRLTGQLWSQWAEMARGTLAAASQMVWRTPADVMDGRQLFAKVVGELPLDDRTWRNSVTWGAAVLIALSAEQSLKAVAIRRSRGACLLTHDLIKLWGDLERQDRTAIARRIGEIRSRTQGTNLGDGGTAATADEIVRAHNVTFVHARYYMETREGASGDLILNVDLWQFALAAYMHSRHGIISPDSSTT